MKHTLTLVEVDGVLYRTTLEVLDTSGEVLDQNSSTEGPLEAAQRILNEERARRCAGFARWSAFNGRKG